MIIKDRNSKKYLLQFATSQELTTSMQLVFRNFITSEMFADLPIKDRENVMFHLELVQDFIAEVPVENPTLSFSDN